MFTPESAHEYSATLDFLTAMRSSFDSAFGAPMPDAGAKGKKVADARNNINSAVQKLTPHRLFDITPGGQMTALVNSGLFDAQTCSSIHHAHKWPMNVMEPFVTDTQPILRVSCAYAHSQCGELGLGPTSGGAARSTVPLAAVFGGALADIVQEDVRMMCEDCKQLVSKNIRFCDMCRSARCATCVDRALDCRLCADDAARALAELGADGATLDIWDGDILEGNR